MLTVRENLQLVARLTGRESELRQQALHDVLTGLANRRLFRERLEDSLRDRDPEEIAVVFVDLDDFKVVNDTMGHATGDDLLRKVANRLQTCVRGSDVAARLGGDEFAVLLTGGGLVAAQSVAGRLNRALRQPILLRRPAGVHPGQHRHRRRQDGRSGLRRLASGCSSRPTWRCTRPRTPARPGSRSSSRRCASGCSTGRR